MAKETLGRNITFPIYNEDGTAFHNLVLHRAVVDSVVMSLGDKITGDVYYKDNTLDVTMHEYVLFKRNPNDETEDFVKYVLVSPPTIVREGLVSDNSELRGMTKYSFVFYHPMYVLNNIPFSDIAVSSDQERYLSQNKEFSWIGYPDDFIAKINKNLQQTQWTVEKSSRFPIEKDTVLSEVLSFNNNTVADALKTWYDTWEIPYVIDVVKNGEQGYSNGKRFKIVFGLPSTEIYEQESGGTPFVFEMGKGVGLKNNSRTPRNNKIITRISGYGSESNIPYGYPQIIWTGDQSWNYTINNESGEQTIVVDGRTQKAMSYPIYDGIVGGQKVRLIKHPFTRTHLMPTVYSETVNKKVNPLNPNYNPNGEVVDYYDAVATQEYPYVNEIDLSAPSYEIHQFEDIKPEMNVVGEDVEIVDAAPLNADLTPADAWNDAMDDEGNYVQSFFRLDLPVLPFDIYACASITEEMSVNMRSGACIGCTFNVQVDWEDYKRNFYKDDGTFDPVIHTTSDDGHVRNGERYPDSSQTAISLIVQKDNRTFGTIMPNVYQKPNQGDKFVVLGISLPVEYITNAEKTLDNEMKSYMLENNVHYYDYPLKFDEYFLATHPAILSQIKPNAIVRFAFGGIAQPLELHVKQLTIKYGYGVLPQYDITLTDNIDVVLNQIGQVADDVERLSSIISMMRENYSRNVWSEIAKKLSKVNDDTAAGLIHFIKGLTVGNGFGIDANGRAILDAVTSKNFLSGGFGGAGFGAYLDENGVSTAEVDKLIVRMKAVFNELEIKKRTYSGGNIIFSSAGNKVLDVLPMDVNGEVQRDENGELVYDGAAAYRCLWLMQDGEEAVENTWSVDDQARCETFNIKEGVYENVSNRYYWRKVLALGDSYEYSKDGHSDIYNYIDLAAGINGTYLGNAYTKGMQDVYPECDVPAAGDNIVNVGNQNPNKRERQNLIEIIVNDTNAPAIMYYEGVNDYSFDGKLIRGDYYDPMTHRFKTVTYGDSYVGDKAQTTYVKYTQDGGAEFKGKVHIEAGSTMSDEFINQIAGDINVSVDMPDITEEVDKALDTLDTGNENLLRNSAFIGEWVDEEPTAVEIMKDTDEMWSRHIKYWTVENVKIEPCSYVASATSATLGDENESGTLKQTVEAEIEEGATYCFSLRGVSLGGGNNTITMAFAGVERTIEFDSVMTRQVVKFVAVIPELNTFTLTGKGTVAELMLNKGAVPNTDWIPSPQDNPRALSKYKELAYMRTSIFEASTDILGGLVLTQMLKVGNYRDKAMIEETGGMSGLMTSPHSPYLWGGGTLEQAFDTIAKYAQNPRYQPTQEELSQMAQFVVTHGGRAILNEAIVRGTVYATNGVFKGRVEASEGEFHGKVVASEGEFHGKIYADEGEFGGLVYTPWKWYYEADGNRFYKENTVIYTFKGVGDDISNDLNIIFGNDSIDENTKNIMFYVSLPTSPKYANKTIKIFSPDYFYDTLNIHKEVFNGVSVSMPTITPSSFGNLRSAPFIYGLSCEDDSDHYRATTIEFDTGILSLSSIIVPDLFAEGGERCAWYVESFTYRRAVITGDGGVKWGNGRGNFGGKKT